MDEAQTIINKRLSIYNELDYPELYGEAFILCNELGEVLPHRLTREGILDLLKRLLTLKFMS